jgi:acyl-CoA thioester hydrolase
MDTDSEFDDDLHYVWENRVRYAETDAQAIVFYGEYVTYQDETMSQFLREIGYAYDELEDAGWEIHVVHVDVDYRAPAEFDDTLVNGIRVDAIHDSSVEFSWRCRRGETVLAEGGLTHVAVDESGEPTRVPDEFRQAVVDYQDVLPDPV